MKNQKLANSILNDNPENSVVYITEDQQPFLSLDKANNHTAIRSLEKSPKAFFRQGFEPEDNSDMEAALEKAVIRNEELETVREQMLRAANLKDTPFEVDGETPNEVAAIVELRELLERSVKERDAFKTEIEKQTEDYKTLEANYQKANDDLKKITEAPVITEAEKTGTKTSKPKK